MFTMKTDITVRLVISCYCCKGVEVFGIGIFQGVSDHW